MNKIYQIEYVPRYDHQYIVGINLITGKARFIETCLSKKDARILYQTLKKNWVHTKGSIFKWHVWPYRQRLNR